MSTLLLVRGDRMLFLYTSANVLLTLKSTLPKTHPASTYAQSDTITHTHRLLRIKLMDANSNQGNRKPRGADLAATVV